MPKAVMGRNLISCVGALLAFSVFAPGAEQFGAVECRTWLTLGRAEQKRVAGDARAAARLFGEALALARTAKRNKRELVAMARALGKLRERHAGLGEVRASRAEIDRIVADGDKAYVAGDNQRALAFYHDAPSQDR